MEATEHGIQKTRKRNGWRSTLKLVKQMVKFILSIEKMSSFSAFNKVGDNSFPNQMAMFLGKRPFNEQNDMPSEVNISSQSKIVTVYTNIVTV